MDDRKTSDEQAFLTTPDVVVKSVPFEATLTDRRIILVDRKDDRAPTREIALATVIRADPGENAIRDPILTLWVSAGGDTRQMIMTFPQRRGATRRRERDEWVSLLREFITPPPPAATARSAPPAASPKKRIIEHSPEEEKAPAQAIRFRDEPRPRAATEITPGGVQDTGPQPYGTFCSRCGNRLAPGSQFCNRCGARSVVPGSAPFAPEPPQARQNPTMSAPAHDNAPEPPRPPAQYHEPPYSTGRIGPHHREKRGFLDGLLSRKKKPSQHAQPSHPPPAPSRASRPSGRRLPSGPSKKTLMNIGLIAAIIIVIGIVGWFAMGFISGLSFSMPGSEGETGGGSSATPTASVTLDYNAISTVTVARTKAPVTVPSDGVALYVNYLGGWKGTYTANGETIALERSGEYIRTLEDAYGTVEGSFQKKDGSSHEIVVRIYKNGAELASDTTAVPNGRVTVSADVGAPPVTAMPTATTTT